MDEVIDGLIAKEFKTQKELELWMERHYGDQAGIWIKIAKKNTGVATVTYDEALEVALCYGWIDGQLKTYDATYYLQRFTPRRPKSVWSLVNTRRVGELTKAGRMKPSGLAAVEAAKKDGRWDAAYASSREMTMPDDFMHALKANKKAREFFDSLRKTSKYAFYYRIQDAKRPDTRQRRIQNFVTMLERGEKLY